MSDYLSHLVDRSFQQATVQPRLASLFEPLPDRSPVWDLDLREANREDSSSAQRDSLVHSSLDSSIRSPGLDKEVSREGTMLAPQLSLKQNFSLNKLNKSPSESMVARLVTERIALQNEESSPTIAQPQAIESLQPSTSAVIYPQIAQSQVIQPSMVSTTIAQPQAIESLQPSTSVVIYPQIAQSQGIQSSMVSIEKPRALTDPATPTIHVTIGRVDVRAMTPPSAPRSPAPPPQPQLSLDAYLRSRKGGRG
ncbi:hypothetical protein NIES4075_67060 [Tolypothrix sp. NIES-4075]|uniref:hypothetical protein n=1 Tax=Tolypothrix sp. NIES-4075 TaxID=2005459 RepID=UPI000B5C33FC|nr:hypothetical protein [Tolypothrix sp. NIES-4075]GAX45685.1 hypothetical protein NIES4075_67060 [Tolypothrix sp. NIES-4075]